MSLDPSNTAALRQTPAVRYVEKLIEIQMLVSHSHSMINHFTDSWDMGQNVLQLYLALVIKIAAFPLCNSSEMITRTFFIQMYHFNLSRISFLCLYISQWDFFLVIVVIFYNWHLITQLNTTLYVAIVTLYFAIITL